MRGLAATGLLLAVTRLAAAHSFDPILLDVREGGGGRYALAWRVPAALRGAPDVTPRLPGHCQGPAMPPVDPAGEPVHWQVDCGARGLRGERLAVDGLTTAGVEVVARVTWRDGTSATGALGRGAAAMTLPGVSGGAGVGAVLAGYGWLGVTHILLGVDHLLFVLGLLLLVDGWRALVRTITAFTAAHSVTLALAASGLVAVPPAPIEALIALSIVLVAAELARGPGVRPTLARRRPWLVAFAFGLLHGLGFASALGTIGLPADQLPLALLAFNLGVEVGQLAFVVAMLGPLALGTRLARRRPWLRLVPAYALGGVAAAWTMVRVQAFWTT
jgi:hypothetical protein